MQYYGEPVRRKAPLDFLAVSDHAEYLGVSRQVLSRAPPFEQSNWFAELSKADEFAGFELLDHLPENGTAPVLAGSFVRDGYRRGLRRAAEVGVNPYAFGLVGSSDYHSATSATEEDNYTGALGDSDLPRGDNLRRMFTQPNPLLRVPAAALSASGVTGVWAERNTRESLFDAFRRREVFATSGPRMQVRLFAGHDYPAGISRRRDWVTRAYATGVPMGARLARGATSRAPRFIVQALKDPDGANLDRVQVIKVWRAGGRDEERVHDVAWSGARRVDPRTGRLPAVGSTVDLSKATYTNAIGAVQLLAEWVDPDFDPSVAAVYYARVLEIPTPRWTTYLAVRNGLPLPESVPCAIQERAWSSPVFYEP